MKSAHKILALIFSIVFILMSENLSAAKSPDIALPLIVIIDAPSDTVYTCSNFDPFPESIVATHDCEGEIEESVIEQTTRSEDVSSCEFYNYEITRVYTLSNECGDIVSYIQNIEVIDTLGPEFDVPEDVTVACEDRDDLQITGFVPFFADECGGPTMANYVDEDLDTLCNNTFDRVWIVTDVCGNRTEKIQRITTIDTLGPIFSLEPQDLTVFCDQDADPYDNFNDWLASLGNSIPLDQCGNIDFSFAAIPGSYDLSDPATFPGTHPGALNDIDCNLDNIAIQFEEVDFVVVDQCGNASSASASFTYSDNNPPLISNCDETRTVELNGSSCDTLLTFDIPAAEEDCIFGNITRVISEEISIASLIPGDVTVAVMNANFSLGPFGPEIIFPQSNFFVVRMSNIDADQEDEVFDIFDEDGNMLITTPNTTVECGDTTFAIGPFSAEKMNGWAIDGSINFEFRTRLNAANPANSINDICDGARIRMEQTYIIQRSIPEVSYFFQVDDANLTEVTGLSASRNFGPGAFDVKFIARDCAGNEGICTKNITVVDNVLPQVSCSPDLNLNAQAETCAVPLMVDDLISIQDLCDEEANIEITVNGPSETFLDGAFSDVGDSLINFNPGISVVTVIASDFTGNADQCTFNITVSDVTDPIAECSNENVPVIAVELDVLNIDPEIILGNSVDNCGITNYTIENNNYACSDLNTTVARNATVQDMAGNSSTCIANFFLTESLVPLSYSVGLCPFDSLKLFLDIPQRSQYTYRWTGPNGFFSVEAEPFIPSVQQENEGVYSVTITNTNNICQSLGFIDVDISGSKIPSFSTDSIGCETLPHRLESTEVQGATAYLWFERSDSLLFSIDTSETPFTEIFLEPGFHELLVRATDDRCPTVNSNSIIVDVRGSPDGAVCETFIQGCIGDPLDLCVNDPQEDWIIRWTGPDEFTSDIPSPTVTDSFSSVNSGIYKLVIESDMCVTDTFTTSVSTNIKPPKPSILGQMNYCDGDTLVLESSESGSGFIYIWNSPSGEIKSNEAVLRIPDVGSSFSGNWTLSIERGPCISDFSEGIDVFVEPEVFTGIEAIPIQCEGAEVQLTTAAIQGGQYMWAGPNGFMSEEQNPVLNISGGSYFLAVTSSNGCFYNDAAEIVTVDVPRILNVSPNNNSECIDPQTNIAVSAQIESEQEVDYRWIGPGISTIDPVLIIPNYSQINNGTYTLVISTGECESEAFEFDLNYLIAPGKPEISGSTVACVGDSLELTSTLFEAGTKYFWQTPNGIIETETNTLILENVDEALEGAYSVTVENGICESQISDEVNIMVNENNFVANVSIDGTQCIGSNIKLFTDLDTDLPLEWELPNGTVVNTDTLRITNAKTSSAGDYRVRSLFNSCPSDWATVNLDIVDPTEGVSLSTDFIFTCNNPDAFLEFCVDDDGSIDNKTFQWFTKGQLLGETSDRCFPVLDFDVFSIGVNQVEVVILRNECEVFLDEILFVEIENVLDLDIDAGPDQRFCIDQEIFMSADEPEGDKFSAFWSFDENIVVSNLEDPFAEVVVINDVPMTEIIWNIEHEECGIVLTDTVRLTQKTAPEPVTDTLFVDENQITFDPLENDILLSNNDYEITQISDPKWGELIQNGTAFTYSVDQQFVGGAINFQYTVCDLECSTICETGDVIIYYNEESCKGNNVLTANNDGVNDRFVIPCIDDQNLPNNELTIINELGNTVFEMSPYDNSWEGTFNGETLPEGTYYYLFRKDENSSIIQGFISIER